MNLDTHILYVEDDPLSREVMEFLLVRGLKFKHVSIFEDSHDFMKRLQVLSHRPQLIFLDIHMQPYDGFDMLKMLRAHDAYQDIRTVALTASVMNDEIQQLKQAGFDGVLSKPLDHEAFPQILDRILNGERIWYIN